ncbi:MAG TPA: hypothetical protein PK599_02420 [bacterium]|nr:hypothetical protein [bacterium]
MKIKTSACAAFLCISLFAIFVADAATILPVNLEEMVAGSDVVFRGRCLGVAPKRLPNGIFATKYTFEISEVLKGDIREELEFTQVGGSLSNSKKFNAPYIYGLPLYKVGSDYLVFLSEETSMGLRAPVGLQQGAFKVSIAADGSVKVLNGRGNKNLLTGAVGTSLAKSIEFSGASAPTSGPIDYSLLSDLVRRIENGEGL